VRRQRLHVMHDRVLFEPLPEMQEYVISDSRPRRPTLVNNGAYRPQSASRLLDARPTGHSAWTA
jgi:hypothetical protein